MKAFLIVIFIPLMLHAELASFGLRSAILNSTIFWTEETFFKLEQTEGLYDELGFTASETFLGTAFEVYMCDGGGGIQTSLNFVKTEGQTFYFNLVSYEVPGVVGATGLSEKKFTYPVGDLEDGKYNVIVTHLEGGQTADGANGKVRKVRNFTFHVGATSQSIHVDEKTSASTISFPTEDGVEYRVVCSTDLKTWSQTGILFEGNGNAMTRSIFAEGDDNKFFKVESVR